jgi:hypothetical protein
MPFESQGGSGGLVSPGGFEFGVQGWNWGEARPVSITFFLDGSAMVCDQHGRPIKGTMVDGKEVWFATTPPKAERDNSLPYEKRFIDHNKRKLPLGTHAEVITALVDERIDWTKLSVAGTPQLPYDQLKKIPNLPPISEEELRRIPDLQLRKDVIKLRRELNATRTKELAEAATESEI